MNQIIARAARLLQNPEVISSLTRALPGNASKAFADPQALARLAGLAPGLLTEDKLKLLSGIGNTVSDLLKGFSAQTSNPAPRSRAPQPSPSPTSSVRANSNKGTAIAAAVSLTAIAGAVVAVGTVSAVALAKSRSNRQA